MDAHCLLFALFQFRTFCFGFESVLPLPLCVTALRESINSPNTQFPDLCVQEYLFCHILQDCYDDQWILYVKAKYITMLYSFHASFRLNVP